MDSDAKEKIEITEDFEWWGVLQVGDEMLFGVDLDVVWKLEEQEGGYEANDEST